MNKIILDGKEYELSDELAKMLKVEIDDQEAEAHPFERNRDRHYFFINSYGRVESTTDIGGFVDIIRFEDTGNYCRLENPLQNRALHETLNRLLWRYSETHGGDPLWMLGDYPANVYHFEIVFAPEKKKFRVTSAIFAKTGGVYFKDAATAEAAIKEVVEPFMEAHPDFVW